MSQIPKIIGEAIFGVDSLQGQSPLILIFMLVIIAFIWIFLGRFRKKQKHLINIEKKQAINPAARRQMERQMMREQQSQNRKYTQGR